MKLSGFSRMAVLFGALLVVITTCLVVAYYMNHPRAELLSDTYSYFYVVNRIQNHHQIVNFWRLPGYPLFIYVIYKLFGQGNVANVSIVQAVLFVLVALEIYCIALLITRKIWIAFLCGLCIGLNTSILTFVKPLMSEALAIFLLTTLSLSVVIFLLTLRRSALWATTFWMFLLFFTRPEWIYVPALLFGYMLFFAIRRQAFKRLFPHLALSLVLLYGALGGYIAINASQNHFVGVTWIQNLNALGKVMQYSMQRDADPKDYTITLTVSKVMVQGNRDPYLLLSDRLMSSNNADVMGKYADGIIISHPWEFISKTWPLFTSYPLSYSNESYPVIGYPFGHSLMALATFWKFMHGINVIFPLCALVWLFFLVWKPTRSDPKIHAINALVILVLYGIITTTFGTYRSMDYIRIQALFDPLLLMVLICTFLYAPVFFFRRKQGTQAVIEQNTPSLSAAHAN